MKVILDHVDELAAKTCERQNNESLFTFHLPHHLSNSLQLGVLVSRIYSIWSCIYISTEVPGASFLSLKSTTLVKLFSISLARGFLHGLMQLCSAPLNFPYKLGFENLSESSLCSWTARVYKTRGNSFSVGAEMFTLSIYVILRIAPFL